MAFGDHQGKAHTDPRNPRSKGVCDFGGEWRQLSELRKQMEWQGSALVWTGYLVCEEHYDKPQEQLRAIRLPPDPIPHKMPRPESFSLIDRPIGFTTYTLWPSGTPINQSVVLVDGNGNPILTNTGQQILIEVGHDGPALLAQLAQITKIPVPGTIQNYSGTLAKAGVAQSILPAAATRSYAAIFNPCTAPIWVSFGTAVPGVSPSVPLGPGDCLFWATSQGSGVVNPAAMTVVGNIGSLPFYAYAAP